MTNGIPITHASQLPQVRVGELERHQLYGLWGLSRGTPRMYMCIWYFNHLS